MKKIIKKIWNREIITYGISGVLTMIVGIAIYQVGLIIGMDYKIANIFSLLLGKLFAYAVNKLWVFKSKNDGFFDFCREFFRFVIARGMTAFIDYFGVIFVVEVLNGDELISKFIFQIIVIIINYVFGKKLVFKNIEK